MVLAIYYPRISWLRMGLLQLSWSIRQLSITGTAVLLKIDLFVLWGFVILLLGTKDSMRNFLSCLCLVRKALQQIFSGQLSYLAVGRLAFWLRRSQILTLNSSESKQESLGFRDMNFQMPVTGSHNFFTNFQSHLLGLLVVRLWYCVLQFVIL